MNRWKKIEAAMGSLLQHGRLLLLGERLDAGYLEVLVYTVREEEMV
jgi:hypothetical protein